MPKKIDLTGQRFGRLTVIRDSGEKKNGFVVWECQCDCGNIVNIPTGNLGRSTKSCGCLRKKIDLTGKKFGRLLVKEFHSRIDKKDYYEYYWNCICDCGNEIVVRHQNLTSKRRGTQSCGCLQIDTSEEKIKRINDKYHKEGTDLSLITNKMIKSNTSGVKGVSWFSPKGKWRATINFRRKAVHLGYFDNLEDAAKARKEAEEKYFNPILEEYGRLKVE